MSTGTTPDSYREEEGYRQLADAFYASSYLDLVARLVQDLHVSEHALADAEAARASLAEHHAFVTTLSHQLRTPVASLRWGLPLLLSQKCDPTIAHGLTEKAENLADLVDKLIFYSEISGHYAVTDPVDLSLNELIHDALAEAGPRVELRRVTVRWREVSFDDVVSGDRGGLARALYFLIDNAVSYSHPGGEIEVKLHEDADRLVLTVADHGIGIPAAEQGRVFERFYRATNASLSKNEGSGVGLNLARTVVEAHGGRLTFESAEGEGTTFRMELPKKR